jgi:hypothetical protein
MVYILMVKFFLTYGTLILCIDYTTNTILKKTMWPQIVEVFSFISSMQIGQLIFSCFFYEFNIHIFILIFNPTLNNLQKN